MWCHNSNRTLIEKSYKRHNFKFLINGNSINGLETIEKSLWGLACADQSSEYRKIMTQTPKKCRGNYFTFEILDCETFFKKKKTWN